MKEARNLSIARRPPAQRRDYSHKNLSCRHKVSLCKRFDVLYNLYLIAWVENQLVFCLVFTRRAYAAVAARQS